MAHSILLLRINCFAELFHTRRAADVLRGAFPDAEIIALASAQSEGLPLLEADPRLDEVLRFPSEPDAAKSPGALRHLLRRRHFREVVACVGATPGLDYTRSVLSLLLCPGKKHLYDGQTLHPLFSRSGMRLLASVLLKQLSRRFGRLAMRSGCALQRFLALRRKTEPDLARENLQRILWIRVDGIGDLVMMLPALKALRAAYPHAQIDLLVRPASQPFAALIPGIHAVYTFEPKEAPQSTRSEGQQPSLAALAARLRKNCYDLALDAAGRDIARTLAFAVGARRRVSPRSSIYEDLTGGNLSFLMTDTVSLEPDRTKSAVTNFMDFLQCIGIPPSPRSYRFPVSETHRRTMSAKLCSLGVGRPYALIHARSAEAAKDWRPERFALVAEYLRDTCGLDVVLTGSAQDWEYNNQIVVLARSPVRLFNAAGAFDLAEFPALSEQARLMVTVDTGPMHIAAMVGTPLVTLFLPWFALRDYPYEQRDSVLTPFDGTAFPAVRAAEFWQGHLLDGISVDAVLEAIDRKLSVSAAPMQRAA